MVKTTLSPLDMMLLPVIPDEAVRLEIRIRDAELRENEFDMETVRRETEAYEERKRVKEEKKSRSFWK